MAKIIPVREWRRRRALKAIVPLKAWMSERNPTHKALAVRLTKANPFGKKCTPKEERAYLMAIHEVFGGIFDYTEKIRTPESIKNVWVS